MKSIETEQPETLLTSPPDGAFPSALSADGRFVIYHAPSPHRGWDVWLQPMTERAKPSPIVQTDFNEMHGTVSPDGRWIAYTSDETGSMQVYVQSFPTAGNKSQVSVRGGYEPKWGANGDELYFISASRKLMSVKLQSGASFAQLFRRSCSNCLYQSRWRRFRTRTWSRRTGAVFSSTHSFEIHPHHRYLWCSTGPQVCVREPCLKLSRCA